MSFLFAPAAGAATLPPSADGESPAEVQWKTSRPDRANTLTQFVCPAQPVQKRSRPDRANPPAAVRVPRWVGAEKEPPVRGEPACGSSYAPVSRCSKRSRPSGSNPPAAVRVPRSAGAAKGAARQGRTRLRQFVCHGHLVPRKEKHRRIASTVLKVCTFTQIAAVYRHPYAPAPAGPVPDDRAR